MYTWKNIQILFLQKYHVSIFHLNNQLIFNIIKLISQDIVQTNLQPFTLNHYLYYSIKYI